MKSLIFKNTVQKGSFRYLVFKEDNIWYAVALEFNLVVSAKNSVEAFSELIEASKGYIEAVKEANFRPFPLNQVPAKEYEDMWKVANSEKKTSIKSPYLIFNYGISKIENIHA